MKAKKQFYKFKKLSKGFTILEVLIATSLLSFSVLGIASFQSIVFQNTSTNNDRAFAMEKALQMFEELRSFVQGNQEDGIENLNNFSDGTTYNQVLTTSLDVTDPGDLLSENPLKEGERKYLRQIKISPVPNDSNARQVTVTVWYAQKGTTPLQPQNLKTPLATISGILKTNVTNVPPTQVYDIYMISIANAPGWWIDLADVRPMFETTLNDIESRNPGLVYRRHYITDMGYGRDPYYMPYINNADDTDDQTLPWTYFYPGKIDQTNLDGSLDASYVIGNIKGRIREDHTTETVMEDAPDTGTTHHPIYKTSNYYDSEKVAMFLGETQEQSSADTYYRKYALADRWNHVMRYPELKAMKSRLQAELNDENNMVAARFRKPPLEPTLAELLEELNTQPTKHKNSIIVNLHGEMLPAPPIRNYSDAAKLPEDDDNSRNLDLPNKRVVTHPENLRQSNSDSYVNFRVYPYEVVPADQAALGATDPVADNIYESTVYFPTHDATGLDDDNPVIASPSTSLVADNADPTNTGIRKLIGDNGRSGSLPTGARPYVWKTPANSYSCYYRTTDQHDPGEDRTIYLGNGSAATDTARGRVATNGIYTSGSTSTSTHLLTLTSNIGRTTNCAQTSGVSPAAVSAASNANDAAALIGQWIVLHDSNATNLAHRKVMARVIGVHTTASTTPGTALTAGGRTQWRTIQLDPTSYYSVANGYEGTHLPESVFTSSNFSPGTASNSVYVTMHKDYKVENNPDVFGSEEDGLLVTLYNTPTRHPMYDPGAAATGRYSGLYHGSGSDADRTGDTRRLYRMEYIPTPITNSWPTINDNASSGGLDLTSTAGTNGVNAKNTARWQIRFETAGTTFDNTRILAETRIGKKLEDGISADGNPYRPDDETLMRSNLYNVSRTYAYVGDVIPALSEFDIPVTEQFQFLGDPRHNPYLDVKLAHRYNRHFYEKRCESGTELTAFGGKCDDTGNWFGYANFDRHTGPSWGGSDVDSDLNWLFYLYSNGIMNSNSVFNSISGWSFYYHTIGGEMGTDGTNSSFNIRRQPWSQDNEGSNNIANTDESDADSPNDITGFTHNVFQTQTSTGGSPADAKRWFNIPWLGELAPDVEFKFWQNEGNLPNRSYVQASHRLGSSVAHSNTYFMGNQTLTPLLLSQRELRMESTGCATFVNGNTTGTGNAAFGHTGQLGAGEGNLTADAGEAGRMLSDSFNLSLPNKTSANRPFRIEGGGGSHGYDDTELSAVRNTTRYINTSTGATGTSVSDNTSYYRDASDSSWNSSAILKMTRASNADKASYVLFNGLSSAGEGGKAMIARISLAALLQTYMNAGDFSSPGDASGRTVPLPRINITNPKPTQVQEDPSTITVTFDVSWKRWDDQKYANAYPTNWYETTPLNYNVKVSSDNGRTWNYLSGDAVEQNGIEGMVYNPSQSVGDLGSADSVSSASATRTFTWDVSGLEAGNHILRIEAYRDGFNTGASYHEVPVSITR